MLRLLVLCAVVACALGAAVPDLEADVGLLKASADNLKFVFYNRQHFDGIKTLANNENGLRQILNAFNPLKKTVLLFHGWQDGYSADSNVYVRKAILDAQDLNVIKVDWSSLAIQSYLPAKNAVPSVGKVTAEFLDRLVAQKSYSLDKVTIVGFSLGAHAAGHVGRNVKSGKIGQIVGLDPAGPLMTAKNRLSRNDGQFVQAIHTNAGALGTSSNCGHVDFFPNGGGTLQPGCGISSGCAHGRAWELYADSISDARIIGQQCGSYRNFQRSRCSSNPTSRLGGLTLDTSGSGVYYMDTASQAPFGRGSP